jgi:GDPmannose 4,6-dehydratase
MKTALITGFTGQDGTFLTRLLLDKGYKVIGLTRRVSTEPPRRVRGRFDFAPELDSQRLILVDGDMLSTSSLNRIISEHQPDEIYNLAWQSHVGLSFKIPEVSLRDYEGYVNLITAVENNCREARIYQASTSEMYGDRDERTILNELTPLKPNSPYAIAKTAAHYYGIMKRGQGMFISNGILFNHESEIRGGDFVTQKIARGVKTWVETGEPIHLGNLDSKRDWGYAGDYVEGMWRMLQHDTPGDYVLATGEAHTIRDFAVAAFRAAGYELVSNQQEGANEILFADHKEAITIDPQFYRPNEVGYLLGDPKKAWAELGWKPKHDFNSLVDIMVKST